ncbi:glycosyltransferase family 2 protein [Sediminitomix flava]|uniref:Glycosyl transferase family 2 n=1 Tax=Sediminitomix flava TaxID=379075 RepID=A0A315ZDA8_SEDFL|nr:glycosyltransferase family A protein [Sediminitomix flava]PWJ43302.1 glycosyl transferase family 2 [Sediminitomix flava]
MNQQYNSLVSVIVPSFNRATLIGETLDSVLAQTYPHWECIIVDDGSTDGSQEVVRSYIKKDKRFKFYERVREPKGASVCRNIGLENCKGDFCLFVDSDDLLKENCLEDRLAFFRENRSLDVVVSQGSIFYQNIGDSQELCNKLSDTISPQKVIVDYLQRNANWQTTGPLWKTEFLGKVQWDEKFSNWQDREFHIRQLLRNPKIAFKEDPDYFLRKGDQRSITKDILRFESVENRYMAFEGLKQELPLKLSVLFEQQIKKEFYFLLETVAVSDDYELKDWKKIGETPLLQNIPIFWDVYFSILELFQKNRIPKLRGVLVNIRKHVIN